MKQTQSRIWRPDFPFAPARWPFFYGWVAAILGALGIAASIPGQTVGVSVFTDYLLVSLGLSRVQLSTAYLIGTVASGLLLPVGGRLLDRLGARKMAVASSLSLAAVLVVASLADRIAGWLSAVLGLALAVLSFVVICLVFFALRFLGQGMLTVTSRAMIGKWWDRRRGLVISITGIAVSFSFSLSPRILAWMIDLWGWRGAWRVQALLLVGGFALLAWAFFRDNPEECGLEMDGGLVPDKEQPRHVDQLLVRELDRGEAARTYTFWAFALGFAWVGLFGTGYTFHIVSLGEQAGMTRNAILALFIPTSLVSIPSNFLVGWWSDRTQLRWPLALMGAAGALCCFGLLLLPSLLGKAMIAVGLGFSGGCFQALMGNVWPRFYGRRHLGAVSGLAMSVVVIGSAFGPFLMSLSERFWGSYEGAYLGGLGISLVLAVAALWAANPQRGLS